MVPAHRLVRLRSDIADLRSAEFFGEREIAYRICERVGLAFPIDIEFWTAFDVDRNYARAADMLEELCTRYE